MNAPVAELNVIFVPVFGCRLPVAAVANNGKQVVSADSSATVTVVISVCVWPGFAPVVTFAPVTVVAAAVPVTIIPLVSILNLLLQQGRLSKKIK